MAEPVAEKRRPNTSFHGRFSLHHSMAEAMLQGTLDKKSFEAANLTDPRFNALAGFEIGTGSYINTVFPEEAAKFLRGEARA